MTLEQLPIGDRAQITAVEGSNSMRSRMFALGLRRGREVAMIRKATLNGPLQVRVGSTDLIIRRREARRVRLTQA
jgi:ferrous iron transport protein A